MRAPRHPGSLQPRPLMGHLLRTAKSLAVELRQLSSRPRPGKGSRLCFLWVSARGTRITPAPAGYGEDRGPSSQPAQLRALSGGWRDPCGEGTCSTVLVVVRG